MNQWPVWRQIVVDNSVDIPKLYEEERLSMDKYCLDFWSKFRRNERILKTVKLTIISGTDLGITEDWITMGTLWDRVRTSGLIWAGWETPYFLRLEYRDQPPSEELTILSHRFDAADQENFCYVNSVWVPRLFQFENTLRLVSEVWEVTDIIHRNRKFVVEIP